MAEYLKSCRVIVHNEEILLVFVVLFVFELELHAENAFLCILISIVSNIAVFIGNTLVVLRNKEQPVGRRLHHIADRFRLDKIQKSTGLDLRIFEDAITFKIALMVVKYMKYMESVDY